MISKLYGQSSTSSSSSLLFPGHAKPLAFHDAMAIVERGSAGCYSLLAADCCDGVDVVVLSN